MPPTIDAEFRRAIPALSKDEQAGLEADILRDGCIDPLRVWRGVLIDGHHRLAICQEHDIQFDVVELDFEDREAALDWIDRHAVNRRNLTPDQAALIRGRIYNRAKRQGARTDLTSPQSEERSRTSERLASDLGVSRATLERDGAYAQAVEELAEEVAPELPEQVAQGTAEPRKVVVEAAKIAKKDPEAAAEILAGKRSLQAERAKARRAERIEEIKTTSGTADQQPGEGKLYQVILADPPWRYEHVRTESRAVENQYPTMTIEEIAGLEVPAGDDAILYLWATAPKLADAFEVVGSWGFIYRTCLVWVKDRIGMGYYARGRHELILIATRGKMPVPEAGNRPDSVIEAPRQEHSRKPDKVYELIERCYPELDKIELFARQPREGWARWGYEA